MKSKINIGPGKRSANLTRFKKIIWTEENLFLVFDMKSNRKLKETDGIIVPRKNKSSKSISHEETNSNLCTLVDTSIENFNHENQNQEITDLNELKFDNNSDNIEYINFDEDFNMFDSNFMVFNEKDYFNPYEQNEADYPIYF